MHTMTVQKQCRYVSLELFVSLCYRQNFGINPKTHAPTHTNFTFFTLGLCFFVTTGRERGLLKPHGSFQFFLTPLILVSDTRQGVLFENNLTKTSQAANICVCLSCDFLFARVLNFPNSTPNIVNLGFCGFKLCGRQ